MRAYTARHALRMARPFETARGVVGERPCALIRLSCGDAEGLGEACPLPGFSTEGFEEAASEVERLARALDGREAPEAVESIEALVDSLAPSCASARWAAEVALWSLLAAQRGEPLARVLDAGAASQVEVNATIGAPDVQGAYVQAMQAREAGFLCFKLKVGAGPLERDVARVRAVRDAIGDAATLRLDANGAWGMAQAVEALATLSRFGVALVEQPVEGLEGLSALKRAGGPKIAADEAARDEASALAALEVADVLVLKPALLGGLARALRCAQAAKARGVGVIVTTLLDGAVGRTAALQLALAVHEALEGPCGLATGGLVVDDYAADLAVERGWMRAPDAPGLGITARVAWRAAAAPRALRGMVIPHPLLQRGRWMREREAVRGDDGTSWSYGRLEEEARRAAAGLVARGVGPGEVVGVVGPGSLAMVAVLHGVGLCGGVIAGIHPRLTAEEAAQAAYRAGCALVVADEGWLKKRPGLSAQDCGCAVVGLGELVRDREPAERVAAHVGLDEPHALLFTSGTTGAPKMAILTWGNQVFSAMGSAAALGHSTDDVWAAPLPLCHVGGLAVLMRCVLLGTCVRVIGRFDAARLADEVVSGAVTLVSLVARMCWQLVEALGDRRPSERFRGVLLGGGPVPATLLEACARAGLPVAPTYGMTEGCSQLVTGRLDEAGAQRSNAPIVWTELMVAEEDAEGAGELWVRGPTVSVGYARERRPGQAVEVDEALSARPGGWFKTGDWVTLGERGLRVVDRRTDLIVSGGENVYPAEVEEVLRGHAGVAEACVVGVPDELWGQRVAAVLVARGAGASDAEIEAHCRAKLAGYKVPRVVRWWEELPRSSLDKVSRAQVRERLWRELEATRRVETP
jgi:O-succinylbenzoic acid--CoA ligase